MDSKHLFKAGFLFIVLAISLAEALPQTRGPGDALSDRARRSLERAERLAEREDYPAALTALKVAIALAPQPLRAHVKYISLKAYFMGHGEEVKAEYTDLMGRHPAEPVYPAALGVALFAEDEASRRGWFEKVVKLAPEWSWGHYAKAKLLQDKDPDAALAELLRMIEKEPSAVEPYREAIFIQRLRLRRTDDAIATAERMTELPELRGEGLSNLWRMRLAKAGTTEEAKEDLRRELSRVAAASNDVPTLAAVRSAYDDLLMDKEAASAIRGKIIRLDPDWYPERGVVRATTDLGEKGPYNLVFAGRQLAIFNKLRAIDRDLPAAQQVPLLQALLALKPNRQLRHTIHSRIFEAAQRAGDQALTIRTGEALLALGPEDPKVLSDLAEALGGRKAGLAKALRYARRAEGSTRGFRPVKDVPGAKGDKFLEEYYSEKQQSERHAVNRSRALEAYGWVLFRSGRYAEAESKLRESIGLRRGEKNLSHLSKVLRARKRLEESERYASEAESEYASGLKRRFTNAPAKDFELATIDGRRIKLSDLKGKVVMLNFWATWCKPCTKEMPLFSKIHEKYKNEGFEILAVSVDDLEDRPKVASFADRFKIKFPVLHDDGAAELYGVVSFPTTVFVGKEGNIRYRDSKLSIETAERDLGIVIEELLKNDQAEQPR